MDIKLRARLSAYTKNALIEQAPKDGKVYGRKDNEWVEVDAIKDISFEKDEDNNIISYTADKINSGESETVFDSPLASVQFVEKQNNDIKEYVAENYYNKIETDEIVDTKQDKINSVGVLKGDGSGQVSAAIAGTDYLTPVTAVTDDTSKEYVKAVTQSTDGQITVTKDMFPTGNSMDKGMVKLYDKADRPDLDENAGTAATPKAITDAKTAAVQQAISDAESKYIKKDGSTIITGNLNLNNHKVLNVANPEINTDATNKYYVDTAIASAIGDITSFEYQIVDQLPPEGQKGVIYLIRDEHGAGDYYDEYIWILNSLGVGSYEKIGNTDIDLSGYLKKDGSVAMTGNLDMGNNKITNLSTPTANSDAATKQYVDDLVTEKDYLTKKAEEIWAVANKAEYVDFTDGYSIKYTLYDGDGYQNLANILPDYFSGGRVILRNGELTINNPSFKTYEDDNDVTRKKRCNISIFVHEGSNSNVKAGLKINLNGTWFGWIRNDWTSLENCPIIINGGLVIADSYDNNNQRYSTQNLIRSSSSIILNGTRIYCWDNEGHGVQGSYYEMIYIDTSVTNVPVPYIPEIIIGGNSIISIDSFSNGSQIIKNKKGIVTICGNAGVILKIQDNMCGIYVSDDTNNSKKTAINIIENAIVTINVVPQRLENNIWSYGLFCGTSNKSEINIKDNASVSISGDYYNQKNTYGIYGNENINIFGNSKVTANQLNRFASFSNEGSVNQINIYDNAKIISENCGISFQSNYLAIKGKSDIKIVNNYNNVNFVDAIIQTNNAIYFHDESHTTIYINGRDSYTVLESESISMSNDANLFINTIFDNIAANYIIHLKKNSSIWGSPSILTTDNVKLYINTNNNVGSIWCDAGAVSILGGFIFLRKEPIENDTNGLVYASQFYTNNNIKIRGNEYSNYHIYGDEWIFLGNKTPGEVGTWNTIFGTDVDGGVI